MKGLVPSYTKTISDRLVQMQTDAQVLGWHLNPVGGADVDNVIFHNNE